MPVHLRDVLVLLLLLFALGVGVAPGAGIELPAIPVAGDLPLIKESTVASPNMGLFQEAWSKIEQSYVGRSRLEPP